MRIFKYSLVPGDYLTLQMPKGAEILSVQCQKDTACIWALVDPDQPLETRKFRWAGTGHPITETKKQLKFIGTFQMRGGDLIFHLFEII